MGVLSCLPDPYCSGHIRSLHIEGKRTSTCIPDSVKVSDGQTDRGRRKIREAYVNAGGENWRKDEMILTREVVDQDWF